MTTATVITIAQQKGGAGKTTVAAQLATGFAERGRNVALVDIDPQGSLTEWMKVREHQARDAREIRFSMVGGWRLDAELDRMRRDHEFIIVDSPPHAESDAKNAIKAARLVIIPVQPSPLDIWASKVTVETAVREGIRPALLMNRVPPRGRSLDQALATIERDGYPALTTRFGNRQAFVTSLAKGLGVVESDPKSPATDECRALVAETLALIN
ncbi:MAG: ParA family protein [Geminicoccaceae bacterium]|nr:ParA family protein [Geminicoccaceae bacterium]MCB9943315.1 ParA family protein [Geminicoccaceae bacterium]